MPNWILKANKTKIFTLLLVAVVIFGAYGLPVSAYADEAGDSATSSDSSSADSTSSTGDNGGDAGDSTSDTGNSDTGSSDTSTGASGDNADEGNGDTSGEGTNDVSDNNQDVSDTNTDTSSGEGAGDNTTDENQTVDNSNEGTGESLPPAIGGGDIDGGNEPNIHPEVEPGDTGTTTATTTDPVIAGGENGQEPNIHPALEPEEILLDVTPIEENSAEYFGDTEDDILPAVDEDVSGEYSFDTLLDNLPPPTEDISSEYSFNTEDSIPPPPPSEESSQEYSFITDSDTPPPPVDEEISAEYNFITVSDTNPPIDEEYSAEYNFVTLSDTVPPVDEEYSNEYFFRTLSDINPPVDEEYSNEYEFVTDDDITPPVDEEHSNEYSFTTDDDITPPVDEEYSNEYNFTTDDDIDPPVDEEYSNEYNFTTSKDDGCTENCGGGGGGGGGHKKNKVLPSPCMPLLLKYIRFGANNDPYEVYKLQWFLRTFENLEVPLSGIYDRQTFEAVKIFQARHASDVLHTWGITEPTGYVYITTQLMVNYIYCDIDEPIRLELENKAGTVGGYVGGYKLPSKGAGMEYLFYPPKEERVSFEGITLDLPETVEKKIGNIFQLATAGFMDWMKGAEGTNWWWLILAPFILVSAYLYRRLKEEVTDKNFAQESQEIILEADREINAEPVPGEADTPVKDGVSDEMVAEYNAANGGHQAGQGAIVMPGESLEDRES